MRKECQFDVMHLFVPIDRTHVAIGLVGMLWELRQELHLLKDLHILAHAHHGADSLLLQLC